MRPENGSRLGGFGSSASWAAAEWAVVYLARQLSLSRWVALKVITPDLSGDPGFRMRFEREARLAASITQTSSLSSRPAPPTGTCTSQCATYREPISPR